MPHNANHIVVDPLDCLGVDGSLARPKVTAVVLHWMRPQNINRIIKYLVKKSYIDEIIIWNNNPVPLKIANNNHKVRIINSPRNLKDEAKYLACSQAQNEVCFYQDDDHVTHFFMDALYFSFCTQPNRLHTLVPTLGWMENWHKTFFNPDENLHATFSWIGAGAMFPRRFAERYLNILNEHFEESEKQIADYGFSVLLNQPLVQLQMGPLKLEQDDAFSLSPGFDEKLLKMQIKVARLLPRFACDELPFPECWPRSVSMNAVLFTSFLPYDFDFRSIIFDPDNEQHILSKTNAAVPTQALKKYTKKPYSFGLSEDPSRWWQSTFKRNDIWGVLVWTKSLVQIMIEGGSNQSAEIQWLVHADEQYFEFTSAQLGTCNLIVNSTFCAKYVGDLTQTIDIKIKVQDIHA